MKKALDSFYERIEHLKLIGEEVAKKREQLKREVDKFEGEIRGIKPSGINQQNKELGEYLQAVLASMQTKVDDWKNEFEQSLIRESFRSELENSFVVIIYGKVNAGKSTLGNFVARNCLASQKPHFRIYNEAGSDERGFRDLKEDKFQTNITECTASIQLFTLGNGGGISWVDTPGLASLTKENGELARAYIESADYVVFPTSSDSPLQQDEISQIKELIELGKGDGLRILITKSDSPEEDEVDGEIVKIISNKSPQARKAQEEDVAKRLGENLAEYALIGTQIGTQEILSLSIYMAQQGLEQNNKAWFEESGVVEFYHSMEEVMKNKAQKLKQKVPYHSLMSLLKMMLGKESAKEISLEALRGDFESAKQLVEHKKQECKNLERNLMLEIELKVREEIDKGDRIDASNVKERFEGINQNLKVWAEEYFSVKIRAILNDFAIRFEQFLPSLDTDIKEKRETYISGGGGLFRTIGSVLGLCEKYDYKTITISDNAAEVIEKNYQKLVSVYKEKVLPLYINAVQEGLLIPCENLLETLSKAISAFERSLMVFEEEISKANEEEK